MKEWKLITGMVIIAIVIRIFMLRYEYVLTPDGVYYAILGKNLISGNLKEGLSTYWPPLYPLLIGLSSLIFRDLELSGRLVSVLAGGLLVIPVYLWSRNSYGKDEAYLSAFLTIIYPSLTFYSGRVVSEPTYMLLLMIGILTGWSAISKENRFAFLLTGLVFGLCYLTRPEAVGYLGLLIIITLSTKLFSRQIRISKILPNILILLLGFIIISFPYVLYLHQETGTWTISEKMNAHFPTSKDTDWNDQWFGLSDNGETTLADRLWAGNRLEENEHSGISRAAAIKLPHLSDFFFLRLKALKTEYEVMIPQLFPPIFIILSGLGLFGTMWSKERAGRETYLLMFLISTLIGYAIMVSNKRYLSPMLPVLICWASKGFFEFENWLIKTLGHRRQNFLIRNHKLFRMLILSGLLLTLIPRITEPLRSEKWDQPYELKQTALWIKDDADSSPLIMSTSPLTAFYSEGKHIYLPDEEYSVIIEYARRKRVDYIVIDERGINELTPGLKLLLDGWNHLPEINLVYKYDSEHNNKVLVFKLADPSRSSAARWE